MENSNLTLSHLETLSSTDLISLADDYGIDIPDNLNRRFIIAELLEVAEELNSDSHANHAMNEDGGLPDSSSELPTSFNETEISVILRNPVWAFVFWDISAEALKKISESTRFKELVLRISYFENQEDLNPVSYYDVSISVDDREQNILLEAGKKFFRVDLVAFLSDGTTDNLCVSEKIRIPETPRIFSKAFPGQELELPKILELSGLKNLLKSHYEKYRQSFVE